MSTALLNESLRALGVNEYEAGHVAWNDGKRGVTAGGVLSCWGGNITDARIVADDKKHCPFVRPNNHDEKIAVVSAKHIHLTERDGTPATLQHILETVNERAKEEGGYTSVDAKVSADQKVVVRFQNTFVPLASGQAARNIAPAYYSHQTLSREDPRNFLLLGTPSGVFVHSDGPGVNKLLAQGTRDPATGSVATHWFSAEPTDTLVGHAMVEDDAPVSKNARASHMGITGAGLRANCFVIVSIPNKQKASTTFGSWADADEEDACPVYRSLGGGIARSARVSVDETTVVGSLAPNPVAIERPVEDPIVVTVLFWNTVEGGDHVETADVALAVKDMEHQYALCAKSGGAVCKLSELPAMLHKLTKEDMAIIHKKMTTDPATDPMDPTKNALALFA